MNTQRWIDPWRSWLMRPRVAHRLPGRLRLSVPALKQIGDAQQEWAFLWRDLLGGMNEIESVEATPATGSVLIRYRRDQLTEAELIAFLSAVNRIALKHWDRIAALPPDKAPDAVRRVILALRRATRHRLALDEKLEIATDVWG